MRVIFISSLLFLFSLCFAGGNFYNAGAKQSAMANTGITSPHIFSFQNNIAATAFIENMSIGLFANNQYLFGQLNYFMLATVIPHKKLGAFSSGINYLGYSRYNEMKLSLAYAKKFGSKFAAGIKFNYHRLAIQELGVKNIFSFQLGIVYKPIEELRIAFVLINPAKQKLEKTYKETLSTQINFGLSYHPSDKLILALESHKNLKNKIQLKLGVEYLLHKYLALRIGAATNPTLFSFGVGTHIKNLEIDIASSWDMNLGYSPQISFVYAFKNKEDAD